MHDDCYALTEEKISFMKTAEENEIFIIKSKNLYKNETFYEIEIRKGVKKNNEKLYCLKEEDIIVSRMTFGKRKWTARTHDELKKKSKEIFEKIFGKIRVNTLSKALKEAREKNVAIIKECTAFIVYNSGLSHKFGNGILVIFDGETLKVLQYEIDTNVDVEIMENEMKYIFTNLKITLIKDDEFLKLTNESSIEPVASTEEEKTLLLEISRKLRRTRMEK